MNIDWHTVDNIQTRVRAEEEGIFYFGPPEQARDHIRATINSRTPSQVSWQSQINFTSEQDAHVRVYEATKPLVWGIEHLDVWVPDELKEKPNG